MKRVMFLVGLAGGYVLGARAGRGRYEQIAAGAEKIASSEPVTQLACATQNLVDEGVDALARYRDHPSDSSGQAPRFSFSDQFSQTRQQFVHTFDSLAAELDKLKSEFSDAAERTRERQELEVSSAAEARSNALAELDASESDEMVGDESTQK